MTTKTHNKMNKFSVEVRERAVRLVQDHRGEYPSLAAALASIAPKIGCSAKTLGVWVRRVEVDAGIRQGVTTEDTQRMNLEKAVTARQGPGKPRVAPMVFE